MNDRKTTWGDLLIWIRALEKAAIAQVNLKRDLARGGPLSLDDFFTVERLLNWPPL